MIAIARTLQSDNIQVEIFRWLYESSILRQRWTYSEVVGEMLLLQFAFVYTTAYVHPQVHEARNASAHV